jgi:macrolide transport system ATP-binding/permease protein
VLESLVNDVRYAFRGLVASPGFATVAILSLALGIGLNSAMFSLVNAMLLRPLPVTSPEQLVNVYTTSDIPESTFSFLDFRDLQRENRVFSGVTGHSLMFANVSRNGQSQLLLGEVVTANYFDVLAVRPALGRGFDATEDRSEGGNRVVVIGDSLWRRQFGSDPSILGRSLRVRGLDYTIVGVMPRQFTGMTPGLMAELWVPASMVAEVEPVGMNDFVPSPTGTTRLTQRGSRWIFVTGRLTRGMSLAQARSNVESIMDRLQEEYPQTNRTRRAIVRMASDIRIHPIIDSALLPGGVALMIAVGLVLLVACANIANMLLARGSSRAREMAIRLAIGARRGRIVRQLLAESLVLASLGGVSGLLLALWSIRLLSQAQAPFPIPISLDLSLDARVLAFTGAIALLTGLVFGLAPAFRATKPDLIPALKNDATTARSGRQYGLRDVLVVAQVIVSVVLLVSAALLTRGALAARAVEIGFRPQGLALATVDLAMHRYSSDRGSAFYRDALDRVRAIPGVSSATLVERLPFSPNVHTRNVFIDGRSYPAASTGDVIDATAVSADYFRTLGVPLLKGRDFDTRDTPEAPRVVIVNEATVRKYWPGADPLGRRFHLRGVEQTFEVIGVARDYNVRAVGEAPIPLIHFARSQAYSPFATVLARTTGDATQLAQAIRREMVKLEPELVFLENQSMEANVAIALFPVRAGAALGAGFSGLAVLLAAVGLYGVAAFRVNRRTREIGIRMALGATPSAVVTHVLAQGLILVGVGAAVGIALAAATTRAISGLLYGIPPIDPLAYGATIGMLLVVAVAANVMPARRAARVDPMIALRTT